MRKVIKNLLLVSVLSVLTGCSNLDVGFEKESLFHSKVKDEKIQNAVVNVYLDSNTQNTDKFRLVINGEDTEMNLIYNIITRFGIDTKQTKIDLFKNNIKVTSISLTLKDKENYFLTIKESGTHTSMTQIKKSMIDKNVKATPIFISEEAAKEEEVKIAVQTKKEAKKLQVELVEKQSIGLHEESEAVSAPKKIERSSKEKKHSGYKISKTLQEKYDAGEAIFYYDPNDGE